jgi:hypothetical protein
VYRVALIIVAGAGGFFKVSFFMILTLNRGDKKINADNTTENAVLAGFSLCQKAPGKFGAVWHFREEKRSGR